MSTASTGISIGGLASGLDTNSIIDSLYNLERGKIRREESRRQVVENRRDAMNELLNRVETLSGKAESLKKPADFNLFTATTNDDELAKISADENALPGSYELVVQQLATTTKVASNSFTRVNTGLGFTGSFEISRTKAAIANNPARTATTIQITANDSLRDVASKINSAEGSGIKASLLSLATGENRLILTAREEGSEGFFVKDLSGGVLGTGGLGIINDTQTTRSTFNFVRHQGGAGQSDTRFAELTTGIGANNLHTGDAIAITGMDAAGNAINTSFTIDPANSTLRNLVEHIQATFGPDTLVGLNASGEITLQNRGAGLGELSLTLQMQSTTGGSLALGGSKVRNSFTNLLTEGTKSFYMLDGMAVSAQSNTDKSTVLGTTFQLLKADPATVVKLELKQDTNGIKGKIRGFVDEFNSLLKFIDDKSKVELKNNQKDRDGKVTVDSRGPLAGESFVRRLRSQLQLIVTNPIKELEGKTEFNSLARIGITTSRLGGNLTIDEEKLSAAIEKDLDGVRRLFGANGFSDNPSFEMGNFDRHTNTGTFFIDTADDSIAGQQGRRIGDTLASTSGDSRGLMVKAPPGSGSGNFTFVHGIASQIKKFYDDSNDFVDGVFRKTRNSFAQRLQEHDDRLSRLEDQVSKFRQRLITQFSGLEQSMQRLKSQSSAFMNQMGSL